MKPWIFVIYHGLFFEKALPIFLKLADVEKADIVDVSAVPPGDSTTSWYVPAIQTSIRERWSKPAAIVWAEDLYSLNPASDAGVEQHAHALKIPYAKISRAELQEMLKAAGIAT